MVDQSALVIALQPNTSVLTLCAVCVCVCVCSSTPVSLCVRVHVCDSVGKDLCPISSLWVWQERKDGVLYPREQAR